MFFLSYSFHKKAPRIIHRCRIKYNFFSSLAVSSLAVKHICVQSACLVSRPIQQEQQLDSDCAFQLVECHLLYFMDDCNNAPNQHDTLYEIMAQLGQCR